MRATELVKLLSVEKSMHGAIKLVTALKLPNLAERFSSILEVSLIHSNKVQCTESISIHCHVFLACLKQERLLLKAKRTTETNLKENSAAPIVSDAQHSGSKAPTQNETSKAVTMSSPKLSAPSFLKKDKTREGAKAGGIDKSKTGLVNEVQKIKQIGDETSDKGGKVGDTRQVQTPHPHDPSMKLSNKHGVNKSESSLGLAQSSRPSNPFLKSSIK